MRASYVTLEGTTPLAFRNHRDQHDQDTHDYLPGSTLRGALAAAHSILRPQALDEFRLFFLGEDVLFGNGYPCHDGQDLAPDAEVRTRPVPATAVTCKRCPGLPQGQTLRGKMYGHGVRDGLIPLALFVLGGQADVKPLASLDRCGYRGQGGSPCVSPAARWDGYLLDVSGEKGFRQAKIVRELRTHTGISRARGTVHQGILYSREMLSRGTKLQSRLVLTDGIGDSFLAFLKEAVDSGLVRVGTNRSRGLGGLRVLTQGWWKSPATPNLAARLKQFNKRFQDLASRYRVRLPHAYYLPITLESDAVLLEEDFRHRTRLDGRWLAEATGIDGGELAFQSASVRRVASWNSLWEIPREDDWAIARGSVFLLGLPSTPTGAELQRLETIETRGVGVRRNEGFGRLNLAEPFHLEVQES